MLHLDQDFAPEGETWVSTTLVATPDRAWAAWTDVTAGTSTLIVRSTTDAEDGMTWDFPGSSAIEPVGFLAPDRVAYEVLTTDGGRDLGIAEPDGSFTELGDFAAVSSASPEAGLIAVAHPVAEGRHGLLGRGRPGREHHRARLGDL